MDWFSVIQTAMAFAPLVFAFLFGIGAGSFINVAVARMPFEKSIIWPSSHCFSCLTAIKARHNVPLLGYLLLRGRCANCQAKFSSRYFWIELITGLAFVLIYIVDVLTQTTGGPGWLTPWFDMPGLRQPIVPLDGPLVAKGWMLWAAHSCLFTLLLAASLIDAEHRIIPTTLTYPGTIIGLLCGLVMPWPWPTDPATIAIPSHLNEWVFDGRIVQGLQLWPAIGPIPDWAPAGTWLQGLLNSLIGAAVGMMCGRGLKFLYESARGIEAIGLGDADLLMMIGAFLGWQLTLLALPVGAIVSLIFIVPRFLFQWLTKKPIDPALPFGPGIAMGAGVLWLGWPRSSELMRITYDWLYTGISLGVVALGLGAFGLIFRGRGQGE
jgi:leader peptidase (prepilin peptidase) / N-methyltransferase